MTLPPQKAATQCSKQPEPLVQFNVTLIPLTSEHIALTTKNRKQKKNDKKTFEQHDNTDIWVCW